jgi:hypothetical protein
LHKKILENKRNTQQEKEAEEIITLVTQKEAKKLQGAIRKLVGKERVILEWK